ncbi:DUF4272 domain-containing protein [Undibacterium jejuense]|uniref:DUF4272 domain-containing protein n=1 Tax=Undibacterium jejuense TaxID=1344949 RepID=A0A923KR58_9BURK|nr:DUF4272 domain-containing protein [Undibacterium jejuense]MBC3863714.1 DUF4272 domain-containing protein [Undibacterium jejuense]
MKSPELRKELSELVLHKRGIRINLQLPLIESEDEISLRSADALAQRLTALSLIRQFSLSEPTQQAILRNDIQAKQLHDCFSANEQQYIFDPAGNQNLLSINGEALRFLLWASGLQKNIGMPDGQSPGAEFEILLASLPDAPNELANRVKPRSKSEILDWADLLYRLHWAVRHAHITAKPTPGRLHVDAVHEWHKAANWLIQYDDENDWDKISTETAG